MPRCSGSDACAGWRGRLLLREFIEPGWQRRVITDRDRAREVSDVYRAAGFEVRVGTAIPEDFADSCEGCALVRAGLLHVVYTRRLEGDQS
ncbi:MAG TPA: hypothetical protein VFO67_22040 [Gemmatimonadales bacterium]|nr:hypothetical protein [Gemmatimonadales bacterium]